MAFLCFRLKDPSDDTGGTDYFFEGPAKIPYRAEFIATTGKKEPEEPAFNYKGSGHDHWQRAFYTYLRNHPKLKEYHPTQI